MQLTLHTTRPTPHGALRLVQALSESYNLLDQFEPSYPFDHMLTPAQRVGAARKRVAGE